MAPISARAPGDLLVLEPPDGVTQLAGVGAVGRIGRIRSEAGLFRGIRAQHDQPRIHAHRTALRIENLTDRRDGDKPVRVVSELCLKRHIQCVA